jgi:hypothetical protein
MLTVGCGDKTGEDTGPGGNQDTEPPLDSDGDGVPDDEDCEPHNPYVYPGMDDIPYNGIDDDCAGDGDLTDYDGDGYDGEPVGGDDCNDGNPEVYPGAPEVCYDGIDQDCAGDEDTNDCDLDGVDRWDDCNDEDATIYPGADEIWYDGIDQNCDYESDYDQDLDGDYAEGYKKGEDCDDTDPEVNSDLDERWTEIDHDCDGEALLLDQNSAVVEYNASYYSDGDAYFGNSVAWMGDLDGDGLQEVLASAYAGYTDGLGKYVNGRVYVLSGAGPSAGSSPFDNSVGRIDGSGDNYLGWDAAVLGDLDGDGLPEIVVGAPLHLSGSLYGSALVYRGSDLINGNVLDVDDYISALSGYDYLGIDVAAIGDVTGDGLPDFAAGAGVYGESVAIVSGAAVLESGTLDVSDVHATFETTAYVGYTTGGADFDGDGVNEVVIGSDLTWETDKVNYWMGGAGTAYVISGEVLSAGGALVSADATGFDGDDGATLGLRTGWIPDADGDGLPELVLSAPPLDGDLTEAGWVYVISGQDALEGGSPSDVGLLAIQGSIESGRLHGAETGGDVDGDGCGDLIVAHIGDAVTSIYGTNYVFLCDTIAAGGTVSADEGHAAFETKYALDGYGYSSSFGDWDGDGDDDLLIGGYLSSSPSGKVWIFESELGD